MNNAASAVEIVRELDEPRSEGWALHEYGRIQCLAGQQEDALESYQRALRLHDELGMAKRRALSLDGIGNAYQELGRVTDAIPFHRQAVTFARREPSAWVLAVTLDNLATALVAANEHGEAAECRREAADLFTRFDDPEAVARLDRITRSQR